MDSYNEFDVIDKLILDKSNIVEKLINILETTLDLKVRKKVVLSLVDNFKDERIIPVIINLIKRPDLVNNNAILVFALGEYSDCKEYLEFLIDIFLNYDYHVALNSYNIIINMPPPFEEKTISKVLEKINSSREKIDKDKEKMIEELISFFEEK